MPKLFDGTDILTDGSGPGDYLSDGVVSYSTEISDTFPYLIQYRIPVIIYLVL